MSLLADLGRALAQLGDPRFLRVVLRALAATLVALAVVSAAVLVLVGWAVPDSVTLPWIGQVGFVEDLAFGAAVVAMLALSVVLMVPVAAGVVGFFLEGVAAAVEERHYPALPPARGMSVGEQMSDGLRFFGLVVVANLFALVIYVAVTPLAPVIFWLVNGFLLGREYFQLVAARRIGRAAAARLARAHRLRLWLAGTAMAVPLSVPVLNLVVPLVGVAVFTHQFHRLAGDVPAA